MAEFIQIPADVAAKSGLRKGENVFVAQKTLDGRWVCAAATMQEFFELVRGRRIVPVELGPADFPMPPVVGPLSLSQAAPS